MPAWLEKLIAPPVFESDEDKTRVAGLLNTLVWIVIAIALLANLSAPFVPVPAMLFAVSGAVILTGLGEILLLRNGRVRLASVLFLSAQWLSYTTLMVLSGGITSAFVVGQFTATMFAGLLLGGHAAMATAGLTIATNLGVLYLEGAGLLPESILPPNAAADWLALTANLLAAVAVLFLADRSIKTALERARSNERAQLASNLELQAIRDSLEVQVADRTRDLIARSAELQETNRRLETSAAQSERRATLLQASVDVSRAVSEVRDIDLLLNQVTQLISQYFGVYHAGIFLIDDSGRYAVLRATNSSGGQHMLARQHRLRVGSEGIVGDVTSVGQPRLALDVGGDVVFFDNPDLPETRSEIALPLRIGDEIIGAVDVQSIEEAAFGADDATVLAVLADQIAIAIQNARLFRQSQDALAEAEGAYRRYLRQEWDDFLDGRAARLTATQAKVESWNKPTHSEQRESKPDLGLEVGK